MSDPDVVKKKFREFMHPRNIVRVVVGHSTRFVVATAVTKIIQPEKTTDKVQTSVGGYVLGGLVAEHTEAYALRKYDKVREDVIELKDELDTATNPTDPPTE